MMKSISDLFFNRSHTEVNSVENGAISEVVEIALDRITSKPVSASEDF